MTGLNVKSTCENYEYLAFNSQSELYLRSGKLNCKSYFTNISKLICETSDVSKCEKLFGIFAYRSDETSCGITKTGSLTHNGIFNNYDNSWVLCSKQSGIQIDIA